MFPELGTMLLGPKTGPAISGRATQHSPPSRPRNTFHPPASRRGPQTPSSLLDPLPHASWPPGAFCSPAPLSCTFCELKDWVQWYRTRLSLGQWAGLDASGASGSSTGLAASLSSAEMGHQLQLVGVRLLGVAMTARNQREERRRLRGGGSLSRPASHGLAEPAPLLRSLPPLFANVITRWASGGGAWGIPGAPSLLLPLAGPCPLPEKPPALSGPTPWKGSRSHRGVGHAPQIARIWSVICRDSTIVNAF